MRDFLYCLCILFEERSSHCRKRRMFAYNKRKKNERPSLALVFFQCFPSSSSSIFLPSCHLVLRIRTATNHLGRSIYVSIFLSLSLSRFSSHSFSIHIHTYICWLVKSLLGWVNGKNDNLTGSRHSLMLIFLFLIYLSNHPSINPSIHSSHTILK